METNLMFHSASELTLIPADAIIFISADGNYSTITMADGSNYLLTLQLGQIERRLAERIDDGINAFIRIGKSLIINRRFITLINPSRQRLTLSDCRTFRHDLPASKEALRALKDFIEKESES